MSNKFNIKDFQDYLNDVIKECETLLKKSLKDDNATYAMEQEIAKGAFTVVKDVTRNSKTEKQVITELMSLKKEWEYALKFHKKKNSAINSYIFAERIRELNDNILNEIRIGAFDG